MINLKNKWFWVGDRESESEGRGSQAACPAASRGEGLVLEKATCARNGIWRDRGEEKSYER